MARHDEAEKKPVHTRGSTDNDPGPVEARFGGTYLLGPAPYEPYAAELAASDRENEALRRHNAALQEQVDARGREIEEMQRRIGAMTENYSRSQRHFTGLLEKANANCAAFQAALDEKEAAVERWVELNLRNCDEKLKAQSELALAQMEAYKYHDICQQVWERIPEVDEPALTDSEAMVEISDILFDEFYDWEAK